MSIFKEVQRGWLFMNRCYLIKKCLQDYLDGCLSQPVRRRVEEHLTRCEACASLFSDSKILLEITRKAGQQIDQPDERFWENFDRKLDSRIHPSREFKVSGGQRPSWVASFLFLRPAFVALPLAVIALAIGLRLFLPSQTMMRSSFRSQDEVALADEIVLYDGMSEESGQVLGDQDLTQELELLYSIDPSLLDEIG